MRRRNKYKVISRVREFTEKRQYVGGMRSWSVHDPDVFEILLNKRNRFVSRKASRAGLEKLRKPGAEIC